MIRPLRVAHTSDVHLEDGEQGGRVRAAFCRVIEAVIATKSELFLIAGDLFDHNRIQKEVIDFVYEQLALVSCPTVIIAGNHDCWEERSVLRRVDFREAGAHVTLIDKAQGALLEFPHLHATVWGRCMLDHELSNKPMADAPSRTRDFWHIGMAHGMYAEDPSIQRSSLITPQEIERSGFDYLALGHVHVHRQMRHGNTLACYPGAPVSDDSESQAPGSITIVEFIPGIGAHASKYPLER